MDFMSKLLLDIENESIQSKHPIDESSNEENGNENPTWHNEQWSHDDKNYPLCPSNVH
jgi:hypothetical protein